MLQNSLRAVIWVLLRTLARVCRLDAEFVEIEVKPRDSNRFPSRFESLKCLVCCHLPSFYQTSFDVVNNNCSLSFTFFQRHSDCNKTRMKTTLVNIRLDDKTIETLDSLTGAALNRQAIARMLLIAAIEAVQKNQGRLNFPPCFDVADPPHPISRLELNEPRKSRGK